MYWLVWWVFTLFYPVCYVLGMKKLTAPVSGVHIGNSRKRLLHRIDFQNNFSWAKNNHEGNFDVHRAVHRNIISIVKPTRCTMYQIYFILEWHSTCFGRSFCPSSAVKDCTYSNRHLSNRYCSLVACKHLSNRHCSLFSRKQTAVSVWQLYVQSWTPDDERKDRPKHVECLFSFLLPCNIINLTLKYQIIANCFNTHNITYTSTCMPPPHQYP